MNIQPLYHAPTFTLTYIVWDEDTRDAIVIDPALDFDPASGAIRTDFVREIANFLEDNRLTLHWILETHAHADHLSGSQWLKQRFGAGVAIGSRITAVQEVFAGVFPMEPDFATDGSQFDKLLADGEVLSAGSLRIETLHTPGHTPACATYKIDDALFTGDALFMPDMGTGRCDFPAGSADDLYRSIQRLYDLPDDTRIFVGHDYQPGGRGLAWETTVGASKADNIQLTAETSRDDFVGFRTARDKGLAAPRLLFPSVQVNIRAGHLPAADAQGRRYVSIPLRVHDEA